MYLLSVTLFSEVFMYCSHSVQSRDFLAIHCCSRSFMQTDRQQQHGNPSKTRSEEHKQMQENLQGRSFTQQIMSAFTRDVFTYACKHRPNLGCPKSGTAVEGSNGVNLSTFTATLFLQKIDTTALPTPRTKQSSVLCIPRLEPGCTIDVF